MVFAKAMTRITFNWNRYWVPREGSLSIDSDGFLRSPDADPQQIKWWKTDAVGFDALLAQPCLVLLGEPGIGKSYALEDAERRAKQARHAAGATFLSRNLGSYNSDSLLVADVFGSPEFVRWQKRGGELHVFLDSFDECLFRVDAVANLLAERFRRL